MKWRTLSVVAFAVGCVSFGRSETTYLTPLTCPVILAEELPNVPIPALGTKDTSRQGASVANPKQDVRDVIFPEMKPVEHVYGGTIDFSKEAVPVVATITEVQLNAALSTAKPQKCLKCGGNGTITTKTVRDTGGFMSTPEVTRHTERCSACEGAGDIVNAGLGKRLLNLVECVARAKKSGNLDACRTLAQNRLAEMAGDSRIRPMLESLWIAEKDRNPKGQPVIVAGRTYRPTVVGGLKIISMIDAHERRLIVVCGGAQDNFVPQHTSVVLGGIIVGKWIPASASISSLADTPAPKPESDCKLIEVTSGNELRVSWQGRPEPVRLIGVRSLSPESAGYEAQLAALKQLCTTSDMTIGFESPGSPSRDPGGVLLAYVFCSGKCLNTEMARLGWAPEKTKRSGPHSLVPHTYDDEFGTSPTPLPVVLAVVASPFAEKRPQRTW